MSISIEEVKAAKKEAEQKVLSILRELKERAGCSLISISLDSTNESVVDGGILQSLDKVDIDILI